MNIEPLAQHVELPVVDLNSDPSESSLIPWNELVVSTPAYDQPSSGASRNLQDVRPVVVASQGSVGNRFWGPSGLRVGVLFINQIQAELLPGQEVRVDIVGTTYINQLADYSDVEEEIGPSTTVFSGGRVSWGDGASTSFTAPFNPVQHTYASAGTYTIALELDFATGGNLAWSDKPRATRQIAVS